MIPRMSFQSQREAMPKNAQTTAQLHSSHMLVTEKAMAPHSSTLAWKIPWTEETGGLPSMGSHRVGHNWSNLAAAAAAHTSKAMLKILKVRLQQYMSCELPDVQAGFRKGRGMRDQIANIRWIIKKAREFQKNIYFCFIDYAKAFDCVDHNKLCKILKEIGIPDHWLVSWEICMQVRKQQLELDMEQQNDSKSRKEYIKAVYCHPTYLTYMQSTSWETLGWKKHTLESRLLGEISITSDMQMTPPLWQKVKRN